jgi:ABC-type uncharacterized transport system ATPase subunit
MPDPLVSIERVTKRFETVTAVDGLSLEVRSGEIFALGMLMYGKQPSWSEVWRWLREI